MAVTTGGQAIPCDCFETGAKWHYVWTRDLSYATDLGLGVLDPLRARNSLQFKLSDFRAELKSDMDSLIPQGRQIIQDTGTGGQLAHQYRSHELGPGGRAGAGCPV
ncbi:hypothetical protein [Aeromonas veronii]|uniref:hypothetical protein n=1 Tax=Aeromonas veronii TaxID=654 RepID=UPI003DA42F56